MSGEAGAPITSAVLAVLAGAGEAGLPAGEIRRHFSYPPDNGARQRRINSVLRQQELLGHAERLGMEPSRLYHNTPCYRWRITDAGVAYLDSGGYAGQIARARARQELFSAERSAGQAERAELARQARERAAAVPPGCRARRDEVIIWARAAGLPLECIAELFGITRERVRQVALGRRAKRPRPCACPACNVTNGYGTSGGVELTDALIERLADEARDYDPAQLPGYR